MDSWHSVIIAGSLWFAAFAALVIIGIIRLDENTKALREVSERMRKGHKSCDESPEAPEHRDERSAIVPPPPARSSGSVAAVSSPITSGRSFPSLPRPNDDDDREVPEHSEVQGESRVRKRARGETLGSWVPTAPDDAAGQVTKRIPRVAIIDAANDEPTDVQGLPKCAACGSIDVAMNSGLFECNTCGRLGALRRASPVPPSPDPPLFVG